MPKSDIHPTWYPEAKVICNGEVVMTTGSTQPEIQVDVWSGNHPFFTGTQKILDTEGRVDRFMRKYGMASSDSSEEKDKASKEDLEARGIKSGEGFSMSANDDVAKSLFAKNPMGYRIGQINPSSLFMSSTNIKETFESYYNSEGIVEPDSLDSDMLNNLAASINQSVGQSGGTTTVIQPVVNNVSVPTPVPQPTPVPVKGGTNTIVIDGKNSNTLAELIK